MNKKKETKMEVTEAPTIHKIPSFNWESFLKKVKKLNKAAAKLGTDPITVTRVGEDHQEITRRVAVIDEGGLDHEETVTARVKMIHVTIQGQAPVLAGWEFLGRIQHTRQGSSLVFEVPGHEIPVQYRSTGSACDHCRTRRFRKDTFIVRHQDTGEIKQVGRTCLADFLGHQNPETAARYCEVWHDLIVWCGEDQDWDNTPRWDQEMEIKDVLIYTAAIIRQIGYMNGDTGRRAWDIISGHRLDDHDPLNDVHPINVDKVLAQETLDWMKTIQAPTPNNYMMNLAILAKDGWVNWDAVGILGSAIIAYQKALGREQAKARQAERRGLSKHVGEIKKRMEMVVTLVRTLDLYVSSYTGDMIHLHIMEDQDGNCLTWKTANSMSYLAPAAKDNSFQAPEDWIYIPQGGKARIKGTVKAHTEYKETAQTELTRVKVLEGLD